MRHILFIAGLILLLSSCEGDNPLNEKFNGTWELEQILANDMWGGPLSWRDVALEKQIRFASGKYYEKTSGTFELIGTYTFKPNNKIIITYINPDHGAFQVGFEFDDNGRLTLHKQQFEGVVAEKYVRG